MDPIPRLRQVAESGEIHAFYKLVHIDQHILDHIDAIPFVETPLHVSASSGHVPFSMEMIRLKPSFARKPNLDGYSPIHLALQQNTVLCNHLVQEFVRNEPDLVRVKGREGVTPLHYVSQIGNVDLLSKFLLACPDSMKDVTVQNESALHIALKHNMVGAFDVLLGWLKRGLYDDWAAMEETILNLRDTDGNTVLHIATSKNISQVVMELLKNKVNVNLKNYTSNTPLDINVNGQLASKDNEMINNMLLDAGALRAYAVNERPTTAEKLTSKVSFIESIPISIFRRTFFMPVNKSNLLLVVVVLMVTATYQVGLAPPGGAWQDDNNSSSSQIGAEAASASLRTYSNNTWGPGFLLYYLLLNSTAFCLSTTIIFLLLPKGLCGILLRFNLVVLYICYITRVHFIPMGAASIVIYIWISGLGLCIAFEIFCVMNLYRLVIRPIGLKQL